MKTNKEMLENLLSQIRSAKRVKGESIPDILLYMDQVTSFMEDRLSSQRRSQKDKLLTKTMINNYAKNKLLPPPVKKKYSKDHVLLLLFIYYFKSFLSFADIQVLLSPLMEEHFKMQGSGLEEIYAAILYRHEEALPDMEEQIRSSFARAREDFPGEEEGELTWFSFLSQMILEVYVKKCFIEKALDEIGEKRQERKKPG